MSYPEETIFKFPLFIRETIELFLRGTFAIGGKTGSEEVYEGVVKC